MDTDTNPFPKDSAAVESKVESESFTKVKSKKTHKRKRAQDGVDMDTEEPVAPKRPQFPPISGDKLKVTTLCVSTVCELYLCPLIGMYSLVLSFISLHHELVCYHR